MKEKLNRKLWRGLGLLAVFLLAAFLRLLNINWDENQHLHPDERFLTMVMMDMEWPTSFKEYLDPVLSGLNPRNVGYGFYVYGSWPLILNRGLAGIVGTVDYHFLTWQGRVLSAVADLFTLVLVFLIARNFQRRYDWSESMPMWTAIVYAGAALAIQLSHFFTVDTFLTVYMTASVYAFLRFMDTSRVKWGAVSGTFWGMALASKLTALFLGPLLLGWGVLWMDTVKKKQGRRQLIGGLVLVISAYLALRLTDPYIFASANWLEVTINPELVADVKELKSWEGDEVWFPPAVQWMSAMPVWFSVKNLGVIGFGIVRSLFLVVGGFYLMRILVKQREWRLFVLLMWMVGIFLYQSTRFVQNMRYFHLLYPYLAIIAGVGLAWVWANLPGRLRAGAAMFLVGLLLFWPLSVMSIYIQQNTRLQASEWIYEHIPAGSVILSEHWDDGLPVPLPGKRWGAYEMKQLPVFDPDTPKKWQEIEALLESADYYVLSSNRAWGSIPKVPEKYPQMARFYEELFDEKRGYVKAAEFVSYPSLTYIGIPLTFPDQWADESFTVYDHPKVLIYTHAE